MGPYRLYHHYSSPKPPVLVAVRCPVYRYRQISCLPYFPSRLIYVFLPHIYTPDPHHDTPPPLQTPLEPHHEGLQHGYSCHGGAGGP
jgi:hypothetical protein